MKIKAIISTGGKGTRLSSLTGGIFPKGLSRLSGNLRRPLVSYQIDQLVQVGVSDYYLSVEMPWQAIILQQSIDIGDFPKANYTVGIQQWDKPLKTFSDNGILKFIGSSDFIWSFGDMYYPHELISSMIVLSKKNDSSVALAQYCSQSPWPGFTEFVRADLDNTKKVVQYKSHGISGYVLNPPYYFQNRALETIQEVIMLPTPRHLLLQQLLTNKGQLSAAECPSFINMNDPKTMRAMIAAIEEHIISMRVG